MVDDMGRIKGFTLVEVMVVVSIIAVLSVLALPVYNKYVSRSQVVSALADINRGKSEVEYLVARGELSSLVTADGVGLYPTPHCSSITIDVDAGGAVVIGCKLIGLATVKNKFLRLERNSNGVWSCDATELEQAYRPSMCG
jgi:type IV pilus assembly protein PilA